MKVQFIGNSDPISFINGHIYEVVGKFKNLYYIIDETGETYLYSLKYFTVVEN